jgi:hypothetical protein
MNLKTILQLILTPSLGFFVAACIAGIWESMGYEHIEFATFGMLALWGGCSAVTFWLLENYWFSRNREDR